MFITTVILFSVIGIFAIAGGLALFWTGDSDDTGFGLFYLIAGVIILVFMGVFISKTNETVDIETKYDIKIVDYINNDSVVLYERDGKKFCLANVKEERFFTDEVCLSTQKPEEYLNEIPAN